MQVCFLEPLFIPILYKDYMYIHNLICKVNFFFSLHPLPPSFPLYFQPVKEKVCAFRAQTENLPFSETKLVTN